MRVLLTALACLLVLATGCSDDPDAASTPTPEPTTLTQSSLTVSDAVPTLEELRELGLGDQAAQCFIDTIDPEGTGRVASAEAFMQAWAGCL